jgi:hypothetical protein
MHCIHVTFTKHGDIRGVFESWQRPDQGILAFWRLFCKLPFIRHCIAQLVLAVLYCTVRAETIGGSRYCLVGSI